MRVGVGYLQQLRVFGPRLHDGPRHDQVVFEVQERRVRPCQIREQYWLSRRVAQITQFTMLLLQAVGISWARNAGINFAVATRMMRPWYRHAPVRAGLIRTARLMIVQHTGMARDVEVSHLL